MRLSWEETSKEQKAIVQTTSYGQRICAFHAREQRADGDFLFVDVKGFCNYAHMK